MKGMEVDADRLKNSNCHEDGKSTADVQSSGSLRHHPVLQGIWNTVGIQKDAAKSDLCQRTHFEEYHSIGCPHVVISETSMLRHNDQACVLQMRETLWSLCHCHFYPSSFQMGSPHSEVCVHRTSTSNRIP